MVARFAGRGNASYFASVYGVKPKQMPVERFLGDVLIHGIPSEQRAGRLSSRSEIGTLSRGMVKDDAASRKDDDQTPKTNTANELATTTHDSPCGIVCVVAVHRSVTV